jgi:hypothetical protein
VQPFGDVQNAHFFQQTKGRRSLRPLFTLVYPFLPCLPLFTLVYPCLPLFYPYLPLFTLILPLFYPYLPLFTLILPLFYPYLPIFTGMYSWISAQGGCTVV